MDYKRGQLVIKLQDGKSVMHAYDIPYQFFIDAAWVYEKGKEIGETVELICLDGYKLTYLGKDREGKTSFQDEDGKVIFKGKINF